MKMRFALGTVLSLALAAGAGFEPRASAEPAPARAVTSPAVAQAETPKPTEPAKAPESKPSTPETTPATSTPATSTPAPGTAPDAAKKEPALQYVTMTTSMGDIVIELNAEKAPLSTANFLSYVDKGFYDGTIFHRIIPNFMIQGGGFTPDMKQKPTGAGVKNEWKNGLKNVRGSVAMARTQVADSGTSQFFINVVDNAFLDQPRDGAAYAVFGKVVSGMDVVDKIKMVPTGMKNGMGDVPTQTVEIKTVKRSEAPAKTE